MFDNRRIRVFVSSTFRDMKEDRDELMSQTWPELRRYCRERQVEMVEVDLRWGIAEEQSTRKETLKLCLDEIRNCRPFFIGLLGERYGWTPGDDAFTADLKEEQPWLKDLSGKSATEMEILHGVLNNPEIAGRSFFYFRDPAYANGRGADYLSENAEAAGKQTALKQRIRLTCATKQIPLHENYSDPRALAALVLADLMPAIQAEFPIETVPDALTREARDHEAFAEIRRRTYIGRPSYFATLDRHAAATGEPLVLLGDSGSGKSALLANWIEHWRAQHPKDFIFQHYIGGTADSADHWHLMARLIDEIKRWSGDPDSPPRLHDELLRDFPLWLSKARIKAEHDGVRCILVLDALNQLEDRDHARLLGWLPSRPFTGPLRLIVSTLSGDTLEAVTQRGWESLQVEALTPVERYRMIACYLKRFGKKLDKHRLRRLATAALSANPLYLKILLDELRVTGTHDQLDARLGEYLSAADIPALLMQVLERYQRDYERDRAGLVSDALGLIWAARRGLTETEILRLLKPPDLPQLPLATWSPLRAALEEALVDRGGILNFAHDFLRTAVEAAFVPDEDRRDDLRLRLADDFEHQPITARSCDELPWLLWRTESFVRLRACLLDVDCFLEICKRELEELSGYWVALGEERTMGTPYLASFDEWSNLQREPTRIALAANQLYLFLSDAALYAEAELLIRRAVAIHKTMYGPDLPTFATINLARLLSETNRMAEAEPLMRRVLAVLEKNLGGNHPNVARALYNLAQLLSETNRMAEAEPLYRRALAIDEKSYGPDHPTVAKDLNNLAQLLKHTNRTVEAEPLMRRSLTIDEQFYGPKHTDVARDLNNLAEFLATTDRRAEAEPLYRRALAIDEDSYGPDHPKVATGLSNLALLIKDTNRMAEAEPLMRRALAIEEVSYGLDHPKVALYLNNLAGLLYRTNRLEEAELLWRRALAIDEYSYGPDHPNVAMDLCNLAGLLRDTVGMAEAEPLVRRALAIDENSYGPDHPNVAAGLSNLALLMKDTHRMAEAEPLMRRALVIDENAYGPDHPSVAVRLNYLARLLQDTDRQAEAEPLYHRALAIDEQTYGPDHPEVACDLDNLATLLRDSNRLAETEPLYHRALAIDESFYGPEHPSIAVRLNNLAGLLQATNRLPEAEPLYRRALAIRERALIPGHPDTTQSVESLAGLLEATGRFDEAVPLRQRVLEEQERTLGIEHLDTLRSWNNHSYALRKSGHPDLAEPIDRRVVAATAKVLGAAHPLALHRRNNLVLTLILQGKLAEARELLRENWQIKADKFATTTPRIAFLSYVVALLESQTNTLFLGQLKTLLTGPELPVTADIAVPWDIAYFFEYLHPQLPPGSYDMLTALVAAMNDAKNVPALDHFAAWREVAPQPLE